MFVCKKCGTVNHFHLMLNPQNKEMKNVRYKKDKKGDIVICTEDFSFKPDLDFMNNHAVCGFCGSIYCWKTSD